MQNKPNFQKPKMNLTAYSKISYDNKRNWTLSQNKPNQSQFRTAHILVDRMKPKLLNFHLKIRKKPGKTQFSTLLQPALKLETICLRNKK